MQFLPKSIFVVFIFSFLFILFLLFIEKLCCLSKMLKSILSEMNEWLKIVTRTVIRHIKLLTIWHIKLIKLLAFLIFVNTHSVVIISQLMLLII